MEHAYIGRQPIFDRELKTFGYELLFRSGGAVSGANVVDGNAATSQVMVNAFLEIGLENIVGSDFAFFNLTKEFLNGELPIPFNPGKIVLEVLEDVVLSDTITDTIEQLSTEGFTLALDDFLVFKDIYSILNQIGFTINVFSGNTIIIEEMPSDVKIGRESQILLDIIDFYKNTPQGSFNLDEKIAAAYAFKNAIKTGEPLSEFQMHNLVDQLFACEFPFYSPNGKAVIISMELDELARKFK